MTNFSGRDFVKGVGIAVSASVLPNISNAEIISKSISSVNNIHRILGCNIRVALPEDDA